MFMSVFIILMLWLELVFLWDNKMLKHGKLMLVCVVTLILIQMFVYVAAVHKMFPC